MKELTKKDFLENKTIELIPEIFSLSKDGTGFVKLSAPLKSVVKLQPQQEEENKTLQTVGDEEFVRARFRALSKILIEDYWLDFRKGDVLKKSVSLLNKQTVYADHEVSIHNWVGVVENTLWDEKSDPPGIDADIMVDATENKKIARGLTIEPPAIHSGSVNTNFLWSKSHPDLEGWDFWWNLGLNIDDEIVRIIVDEILSYGEFSLVWQGADPFAKRKLSAVLQSLRKEGGVTMEGTNEKVQQLEKKLEELKKENEKTQEDNTALVKEKEELVKNAELGKKYIEDLKTEIESLYRLLKGEAADDDYIEKMIKSGSVESLQILKKDFEDSLKDEIFLTCPHCGKEVKGIRSSLEKPVQEEKIDEAEAKNYKV